MEIQYVEWSPELQRVHDLAMIEVEFPHLHDAFLTWYSEVQIKGYPQA